MCLCGPQFFIATGIGAQTEDLGLAIGDLHADGPSIASLVSSSGFVRDRENVESQSFVRVFLVAGERATGTEGKVRGGLRDAAVSLRGFSLI